MIVQLRRTFNFYEYGSEPLKSKKAFLDRTDYVANATYTWLQLNNEFYSE